MAPRLLSALALVALSVAAPVSAADEGDTALLRQVRAVDMRMAAIAYRLTTANARLCDRLAPTPGIVVHALGQYDPAMRGAARMVFGFAAPIAIEGVVPGSAAARAGVAADDALLAVDGKPVGAADPGNVAADSNARDAAVTLIADQPVAAPLRLSLLSNGKRREVTVPAMPGCRSAFEVLIGPGMTASSDGRIVQIGVRFFERYGDDDVAVVVAHELAHTVLRHRARLDAAGVKGGMLAELGRNGRLNRRIEEEADLLGMYLLRNAGYDPSRAVRFWRAHGGDVDGGLFRSRTHPSSSARAAAIAAEIARIPANAPKIYVPPIIATRDAPLE